MEQRVDARDAAKIFPIDEAKITDLANDIKSEGQQVPIELLDGLIIDGRRRYAACEIPGVD